MKNIFKVIVGVATISFVAVSCDVSNKGTLYTPDGKDAAVSFAQSTLQDTEIDAKTTKYEIELVRGIADGTLTVNLKSELPNGVTCPTSVSFEAGSYTTSVSLDISGMAVGKKYAGKIQLADANSFNSEIATSEIKVTFAKAYTWVSLGKGKIYDGVALQVSDDDLGLADVEILKAEGFNRWRVMTPFPEKAVKAAWGDDFFCGGASEYIELYILDETAGTIKYSSPIKTGLFYADLGDNAYIWYYYPTDYNEKLASYESQNTFLEDGKVIQIACAKTIENTSNWFGVKAIYIAMPDFASQFEEWLRS